MKLFKSKILIASVICISFFAGSLQCDKVFAQENQKGEMLIMTNPQSQSAGERVVEMALAIEEAHPSRGSGTQGERETSKTLAKMLENGGFEKLGKSYTQEFLYTPLIDTSNTTTVTEQHKTSVNVIGQINNNKEQTIVIGAHYDNYAKEGEKNGTGFYSNLLGVAGAFEIASELSQVENLDYNIILAFWGAGEDGLHGSEYFVSSLTNDELSKISLYVNLDSVGVGDELNIFTNEVAEDHEEVFIAEANKLGYKLHSAPRYKGYTLALLPQRPFMHLGISSDNYHFMINEVPCANFISYVWNSEHSVESRVHQDIMYTANDNSEYIFETYGRDVISQRMTETVEIITATLSRGDIINVMQNSKESTIVKESFYDDSLSTIVGVCMVGIFALVALIVIKKLSKEVKMPEDDKPVLKSVKIENIEVFGETVVLQDGVRKRKPEESENIGFGIDGGNDKPQNPFEF